MSICTDSHKIKGRCFKCWNYEGCEVMNPEKGKIQLANMRDDIAKGKKEKRA